MLPVSQTLLSTLEQDITLEMKPRVVFEWEHNATSTPTVTVTESYASALSAGELARAKALNETLFPLESIIKPLRPEEDGLPKLNVGTGLVNDDSTFPKFRIPGEDDHYKFWRSLIPCGVANDFSNDIDITVDYGTQVTVNKIVAGFECSLASPTNVEIFTSANGSTFTSRGAFTPDADGRVNLWRQANGTWSTTEHLNNADTAVQAIRLRVRVMDTASSFLEVIQFGARLEQEVTDRVMSVSVERSRESQDLHSPIGVSESNTVSMELSNEDGYFTPDNASSPIFGLIQENFMMKPFVNVTRSDDVVEGVQQGVFFMDTPGISSDGSASFSGTDRSKFLQEEVCPNILYRNKTPSYIARDLLERLGVSNFSIRTTAAENSIPYVWFEEENIVWDSLSELARAEGAVFYFNEDDQFVWESREYMWLDVTIDYTLYGEASGSALSNFETLNYEFDVAANSVNVTYSPIKANTRGDKVIVTPVWEPTETVALRGVQLQSNMTAGSTSIDVGSSIATWPDEGVVNIEGEYIRYSGKSGNTLTVTKRGEFNTTPKAHNVDLTGWKIFNKDYQTNTKTVITNGSNANSVSGAGSYRLIDSKLRLHNYTGAWNDYLIAINGTATDSYSHYGAKFTMPPSHYENGVPQYKYPHGAFGLVLHNDAQRPGYFFGLLSTKYVEHHNRPYNEVVMVKNTTGSQNNYPVIANSPTPPYEVIPGRDYYIDVFYDSAGNTYTMYVNGLEVGQATDTSHTQGYWGVFARGGTLVDVEYMYTIDNLGIAGFPDVDATKFYDRVNGSFAADYALTEWSSSSKRYAEFFMDDFGPWVHEAREYDVRYNVKPAVFTQVFSSNDSGSHIFESTLDPFKGRFVLVNSSRGTSIVNGSDELLLENETVEQRLMIYGQAVIKDEQQTYSHFDASTMKKHGKKAFEASSPWIQTKKQAKSTAEFIVDKWKEPLDIINVEGIYHPALQPGDLVAIHYPQESMTTATHKYHVISISSSIGDRYTSSMTLRRLR